MNINDYIEKNHMPGALTMTAKVRCKDGFTVSVQASKFHYCTPREDRGPYSHVELGFPSAEPPPYVLAYAENQEIPTGTVYGYVPVELVEQMIEEHGGLA